MGCRRRDELIFVEEKKKKKKKKKRRIEHRCLLAKKATNELESAGLKTTDINARAVLCTRYWADEVNSASAARGAREKRGRRRKPKMSLLTFRSQPRFSRWLTHRRQTFFTRAAPHSLPPPSLLPPPSSLPLFRPAPPSPSSLPRHHPRATPQSLFSPSDKGSTCLCYLFVPAGRTPSGLLNPPVFFALEATLY